ncbi:MAG: exo-alpha-sialidase [Gemmatimonadetes bacterium]|nr:exo-alpha-sialidase [Gemmatimonadota bacterium]MBT4608980.1 exo-alpha-sialidase [Gemmatimonadota bacterium]MBT5060732.1 exo-alpha-sialidase [Gemmatimonadota bacterium]MBT5145359.1 exo-alpha-sialidase [Gemmatimonadota bacterium]MBT5591547.1 exo-alpha-sialidase [Gemmatimonadota bacterium]
MASFDFRKPAKMQQQRIYSDAGSYSAFPHVERLEGEELLLAFREAPRHPAGVRHTHPRSLITVIRSKDAGQTWAIEDAAQMAAGGGQEFGLIYLGKGRVGGALAFHEVVPEDEAERAGISHTHPREYPFSTGGTVWCTSDNYGLTWRLDNTTLIGPGLQACAPPIRLRDGTLLISPYGALGRAKAGSAVLFRSDDGGNNWSGPNVIARGNPRTRSYQEPSLMELAPGHLLCMMRVHDPTALGIFWRCESQDAGQTWSRPTSTGILSGACPRLLTLRDGRLLLTYGRRSEPYGIYATCSEDGGNSWGETWQLRPARDGDHGYTSSVELDDGRLLTTTYGKNPRGVTGITGTYWYLP